MRLLAAEGVAEIGGLDEAGADGIRVKAPIGGGRHGHFARGGILRLHDVAQPFGVDIGLVEKVEGGLATRHHVVEPAHALVALRAVGGNGVDVAGLRRTHHPPDVVEEGVAAFEAASGAAVVAERDAGQRLLVGRAGQAADFHVAEAVVGEMWLKGLAVGRAFGDVDVLRLGIQQIGPVGSAVCMTEL